MGHGVDCQSTPIEGEPVESPSCNFDEYADVYAAAPYATFAIDVAKALPALWKAEGLTVHSLLDLACGTGSMLHVLAAQLDRATGVDSSERMLGHARAGLTAATAHIDFVRGDMRDYRSRTAYDAVTCIYNTVNAMVNLADLRAVLDTAYSALTPGGAFVFDTHTPSYVVRVWADRAFVTQDDEAIFEVWKNPYDAEEAVVYPTVTVFRRDGERWQRIRETHPTRGYDMDLLTPELHAAGFERVAAYGGLAGEPVTGDEERVWVVAHRPRGS